MKLYLDVVSGTPRKICVELLPNSLELVEARPMQLDCTPNALLLRPGECNKGPVFINGTRWDGKAPLVGDKVSIHSPTQNRTYQLGTVAEAD